MGDGAVRALTALMCARIFNRLSRTFSLSRTSETQLKSPPQAANYTNLHQLVQAVLDGDEDVVEHERDHADCDDQASQGDRR